MRLEGKRALVFGAGQLPGRTIGNGKATSIAFAREGAKVFCIDRYKEAAEETAAEIRKAGGVAEVFVADVTDEATVVAAVRACNEAFGGIDILQNNVGISIEGGDALITEIEIENFDRIVAVNLRGMVLTIKHTLPIMCRQESGVITNISSMASLSNYPYVGYKTTKAAVNALTGHVAIRYAAQGVRSNVILPGLLNTPIGVENRMKKFGMSYEEVVAMREKDVPLRRKMGSAWDIANASVFLASDEAQFITGVVLPVDGGQSVQIGRPPSAPEQAEAQAAAAAMAAANGAT